ncbi:charged multivesicular body protein 5-like [Schistocerca gregaria]|uniref:charged multivesicular body protein 5-like n=1 Tax=Schistocerca gregaria TaxID=7010 RepID=UPI00211EA6C0|nr:charged multivesicular body protein 5-like [Schistocerca gregaria]
MMNRLFGMPNKGNKEATLEHVSQSLEGRIADLDAKLDRVQGELAKYADQLKAYQTRGVEPPKALKQRMMNTLRQKRMYEAQRDQLANQQFSLEKTSFAIESMKESLNQVEALKTAKGRIETYLKQADLNTIEALQDDLNDLLTETDDIQHILGNESIEYIDEDDLQLELDSIESGTFVFQQQNEQDSIEIGDIELGQPLPVESVHNEVDLSYTPPTAMPSVSPDAIPTTVPPSDRKTVEPVYKTKTS